MVDIPNLIYKGIKNSETSSIANTDVMPQAITVMLWVYDSSFSPKMVAVLILVKSNPAPTSKNPRLRSAKNKPLKVLSLVFLDLYQEIKATIPVKKKKLLMISQFM